jgi:hypothetical protein
MKIKNSVSALGVKPEIMLAIIVAERAYQSHGYELVITSLTDGKHSRTSLHYAGCAVDLRTRNLANDQVVQTIANEIREGLNDEFDVVVESTHIHIEWQPKR